MMNPNPEQVFQLVDTYMGGPFRWGKEDCLIGCANVFLALTGKDIAAEVRGKYSTEKEAAAILAEYGGSLLIFIACRALVADATRAKSGIAPPPGALGVSPREFSVGLDGRCTSIHIGNNVWVTKAARGFTTSAQAEEFFYV